MNADKRRSQGGTEVAQGENNGLFGFSGADAGKTENAKLAKPGGEIRFGYFIERQI